MARKTIVLAGLLALGLLVPAAKQRGSEATAHEVGEKTLLENAEVLVMEYVFPPGFKGEEHEAVHYSVNDTKRPARVLVVMLKER